MGGMIHIADWYATFARLASVDPTDTLAASSGLPPIDSIDMWSFLSGKVEASPREVIPISKLAWCKGIGNSFLAELTLMAGRARHTQTAARCPLRRLPRIV